eukprot:scaffold3747_cov258-Ochromonas_danica.AAC.3
MFTASSIEQAKAEVAASEEVKRRKLIRREVIFLSQLKEMEKEKMNDDGPVIVSHSSSSGMIFDLNQDILRSILELWLNFKDISNLDQACLGSCRTSWLIILTGTRVPIQFDSKKFNLEYYETLYPWLRSRRVGFEAISVVLPHIQEVLCFDERVCGYAKLLEIDSTMYVLDEGLYKNLGIFMDRCINVDQLNCRGYRNKADISSLLLKLIEEHVLRLRSVALTNVYMSNDSFLNFLSRYASTLKELVLINCKYCLETILTILQKSAVALRVLTLRVDNVSPRETKDLLLSYLTSFGTGLESLSLVNLPREELLVTEELIQSILSLFPSLSSLSLLNSRREDIGFRFLSGLFRSFPRLKRIGVKDVDIQVMKQDQQVAFDCGNGSSLQEECLSCLLHLLKDDHALSFSVSHGQVENDMFSLIIDKLSPYLVSFEGRVPNITDELFEEMVKKCQCLEKLVIDNTRASCTLSDKALEAIAKHRRALKELSLSFGDFSLDQFTDQKISELLIACKSLVNVTLPLAGCDSIRAVRKLPRLKSFSFDHVDEDKFDEMLKIVLNNNFRWPDPLKDGVVEFENESSFNFFLADKVDEYFGTVVFYDSLHILKKKGGGTLYFNPINI